MRMERSRFMKEYRKIFAEEIEVPDIVLQKAEDAFATIKAEGNETMIDKRTFEYKRRNRFFRGPAAAAACACILVLASITSAAAVRHFWSRGVRVVLRRDRLR